MPVITNSVFLAEFKARCAKIKNATIAGQMIRDVATATASDRESKVDPVECLKLIEPAVDRVEAYLLALKTDARFTAANGHCTILTGPDGNKPGTYHLVKDVFADKPRRVLVGFFASLAVPIAALWVNRTVREARANIVADAVAAALIGDPLQPAARAAAFEAASMTYSYTRHNMVEIASAVAAACGASPQQVTAVNNSGNQVNAVGAGNAAVNALNASLPAHPVNIVNAVRAAAHTASTNTAISYAITPQLTNAFQALPVNSLARTGVTRRETFFCSNMESLCLRLLADWDDINNLFFPNDVLKKLVHIQTTGADFHKEGKQVLILTFKAHAPGVPKSVGVGIAKKNWISIPKRKLVKLIYKPSDIEMDWRICGDSQAFQVRLPGLWGAAPFNVHSLFCQINAEFTNSGCPAFPARGALPAIPAPPAATPLVASGTPIVMGTPIALPVYQILPRNPGSTLVAGGGAVPLNTSYGYIEHLSYLPECTSKAPLTITLPMAHPEDWDYVTRAPGTPEGLFDLRNFYRVFGWYAALGIILNFGDQHRENVIVHRREPCLIDLEICFKHRALDLEATMLEYHFKLLDPKDDKNVLLCRDGALSYTMGKQAGAYMALGYDEALTWIRAHHAILSGWLNTLNQVIVRYTPRPTQKFTDRVWEAYNALITANVPTLPGHFNRKPFSSWLGSDLALYYNFNGRTLKGRPLFALNVPDHDWACYLNTDAPAYYRRLGSLDLLNARGRIVAVADPGGPGALGVLDLPSEGEMVLCELLIPAAGAVESVLVTAKGTPPSKGQFVRVELRDNVSGIANQPMAHVLAVAAPNTTIVITFPSDGLGASAPPTSAALRDFMNNTGAISQLVGAALSPAAAPGTALMAALAPAPLWLPNRGLTFPGAGNFFSMDTEADPVNNPPLTPVAISLDRLTQIQNNTEAASNQAWTNVALKGQPLAPPQTLADVINEFRTSLLDLSHQWTDGQNITSVNF